MLHIALWEPEIPPNTGNIARLCAATGCPLHLIGPLGFRIDEKSLRRAGLDYWDAVDLHRHDTLADFEAACGLAFAENHPSAKPHASGRIYCLSARAVVPYTNIPFQPGDCLLFGSETRGLPPEVLERYREQSYAIPMPSGKVRSLNLATSVGIVLYEGLRQLQGW
ncbi:MAG: tRNA (cytidine(34)-2'-O)-methyltransferase [Planctomycetes bacterium]|nr:tRNA (cytidine(34)-2'-O)-methyltransferase [Planctomycetota bacterium]